MSRQRPPASTLRFGRVECVEQLNGVLAAVAREVAGHYGQAGAYVAGEVEGGDSGTKSEGRKRVPEIVDPAARRDSHGELRRPPLEGPEVVDVEVAAAVARKEQRRVVVRRYAFESVERPGTARRLASVFGRLSSRRVKERRT